MGDALLSYRALTCGLDYEGSEKFVFDFLILRYVRLDLSYGAAGGR